MAEPPFVGESRFALVEGLLEIFDEVTESETPVLVSLEAPSSWGKTRVVQEFYKRLAARQASPKYWPETLLGENEDAGPERRRKRVFPESMTIPAGAAPEFAWLGIACGNRPGGSPTSSLRLDIGQFQMHLPWFEDRWRKSVNRSKRFSRWASGKKESAKDVGVEGLGMLLPIPALGLVVMAADQAAQGFGELAKRRRLAEFDQKLDIGKGIDDVAAEFAEQLLRIAVPSLPMVIFVEDLHLADEVLVRTLQRVLSARTGAVMVITTCWPGQFDERTVLSPLREIVAPERKIRVIAGKPAPAPFVEHAGLEELGFEQRCEIVRSCLPTADDATVELVAHRYVSPLAIELFCRLGKVQRRTRSDGVLRLQPEEVEAIPEGIRDLYAEMWKELPSEIQMSFAFAALSSPLSISKEWGNSDDRWNSRVVIEAIAESGFLKREVSELKEQLGEQVDAYGWARSVDDWLRRFVEIDQRAVALDHAQSQLFDEDVVRFRIVLSGQLLTNVDIENEEELEHWGWTVLSLYSEGLTEQSRIVARAALEVIRNGEQKHPRIVYAIAELGLDALLFPEQSDDLGYALWTHKASAIGELGKPQEARLNFEYLLELQNADKRCTATQLMNTRNLIAVWLGEEGRLDEAIHRFSEIIDTDEWHSEVGPEFRLGVRGNQARLVQRAGRLDESIELFEALLAEEISFFGKGDPRIARSKASLARSLGSAGRLAEAIDLNQSLLVEYSEILGESHELILSVRTHLALDFDAIGRSEFAIEMLESIVSDYRKALGADHPASLIAWNNMAFCLGNAGRNEDAITEFEAILQRDVELFGWTAPQTMTVRGNLASLYGKVGLVELALETFRKLVDDQIEVLGLHHPDTLRSRNNIVNWLGASGNLTEAISEAMMLRIDQEEILGPDNPACFVTRGNLGVFLAESGDLEEGVRELESLLEDATRVLGAEHPFTERTRLNLASFGHD